MTELNESNPYNERLFTGSRIRRFVHNARFNWFRETTKSLFPSSARMVELGCFDGRLLDYCPFEVSDYHGFDANQGGGLRDAQRKYSDRTDRTFTEATLPSAMEDLPDNHFDIGASLETLEHIPPQLVAPYLEQLARVIDGYFIATVPNEIGFPFITKHTYKTFVSRDAREFKISEVMHSFLGNTKLVERNSHKGFDYRSLIQQISEYFDIVAVENVNAKVVPVPFAFTIGIVCKSK